jgi:hypothetical protein
MPLNQKKQKLYETNHTGIELDILTKKKKLQAQIITTNFYL